MLVCWSRVASKLTQVSYWLMELSTGYTTPNGTSGGPAEALPVGWSAQAPSARPAASAARPRPRAEERYCMVWDSRVGGGWEDEKGIGRIHTAPIVPWGG